MKREVFGRKLKSYFVVKGRLKQDKVVGHMMRKPRKTANSASAWGEYVKNWTPGVPAIGGEGTRERKRLRTAFEALTNEELQTYEAGAISRNGPHHELGHALEEVERPAGDASHYARNTALKRKFLSTVDAVEQDPFWRAGAPGPWLGIRPELINVTSTITAIQEKLKLLFRFDPEPVQNPPGTHPPEAVCVTKYWGTCEGDVENEQCQTLTKNLHIQLRSNGIVKKTQLPLGISLAGPAPGRVAEGMYLVADVFGQGETQILLELESVDGRPSCYRLKRVGDLPAIVSTSQRTYKRILQRAATAMDKSSDKIGELSAVCYAFTDARGPRSEGLALRFGAQRFDFPLPTNRLLRGNKRKPDPCTLR